MDDIIYNNSESYYENVKAEINKYATEMKLSNLELIDNGKYSCVLKGVSATYGNVILKKRMDKKVIEDEFNTLKEFNGRRFCRVYEANLDNGIFIEELVMPGNVLREVDSLDERLATFCSLHKGLHIMPEQPEKYPTYLDWVSRTTRAMEAQENYIELCGHMQKAEVICKELFLAYPQKMLLHGDLHHDNILLNHMGGYTIIDPKGVLGNPVFDIPRFILNEMEDEITQGLESKINYIINIIGKYLDIPVKVLKQLFYMEVALAESWNAEGGIVKLDNIIFAEKILRY